MFRKSTLLQQKFMSIQKANFAVNNVYDIYWNKLQSISKLNTKGSEFNYASKILNPEKQIKFIITHDD